MTDHLLVDRQESVTVLTLNRPDKLNAMDSALYERLITEIKTADEDPDVRAIIIRGNGRAFCTGADVGEFEELTPDQVERVEQRAGLTYGLHQAMSLTSTPIIGAIHGYAVGGGCGLAVACDITIASANVQMGYPEIKHGLVAAVVMANLTKQIGRKAGFDLVASGRLVGAVEAQQMGLVTRVAEEGREFDEAMRTAQDLARRPPQALQATKRLYMDVADVPLAEGLVLGRQANEKMRAYRAEALKTYKTSVKGLAG
jgi:enoyl-CoA hydratase